MVSFDYDGTLDREDVQDYARALIARGVEVWVCTFRFKRAEDSPTVFWTEPEYNKALFEVCDKLGIPRERIIFTEGNRKSDYINQHDFIWHIDDDWFVLKDIQKHCETIGVSVKGVGDWKGKCERILNYGKKRSITRNN